ncbi:unnamed protein product [Chrysoparadoxa australica]
MGFTMEFYNEIVSKLVVSTNGYVSFASQDGAQDTFDESIHRGIPTEALPPRRCLLDQPPHRVLAVMSCPSPFIHCSLPLFTHSVAPLWEDLVSLPNTNALTDPTGIWYGTMPNPDSEREESMFVVQWTGMRHVAGPADASVSFELVLHQNGDMQMNYPDMRGYQEFPPDSGANVGVQHSGYQGTSLCSGTGCAGELPSGTAILVSFKCAAAAAPAGVIIGLIVAGVLVLMLMVAVYRTYARPNSDACQDCYLMDSSSPKSDSTAEIPHAREVMSPIAGSFLPASGLPLTEGVWVSEAEQKGLEAPRGQQHRRQEGGGDIELVDVEIGPSDGEEQPSPSSQARGSGSRWMHWLTA